MADKRARNCSQWNNANLSHPTGSYFSYEDDDDDDDDNDNDDGDDDDEEEDDDDDDRYVPLFVAYINDNLDIDCNGCQF